MIFHNKSSEIKLYNTLLTLSRNIFFYNKVKLADSFETRIYLMFIHFSILLIIYKKKGQKFEQKSYDSLFHNIENNLRELGFGDVSVNKKMKDFNKLLYDILLKLERNNESTFKLNESLILKYFTTLKNIKTTEYQLFESYFVNFYNFCFELPLDNMILKSLNFTKNYGSS